MAITYLDNGDISDSFELAQPNGSFKFSCSIIMNREKYETLTEEQIQQMKQVRYDNWYSHVTAASAIIADDTAILYTS
jgi:hypothetical protein